MHVEIRRHPDSADFLPLLYRSGDQIRLTRHQMGFTFASVHLFVLFVCFCSFFLDF